MTAGLYFIYVRPDDPDCRGGTDTTATATAGVDYRPHVSHFELGERAHYHDDIAAHGWDGPDFDPDWQNPDCPAQCSTEHDCPTDGEVYYCPEADQHFAYCDGHGEHVPVYGPRGYVAGRNTWHRPGRSWPEYLSDVNVDSTGDPLCSDCYSETWDYCDGCSGEYYQENMHWCEECYVDYCSDCFSSDHRHDDEERSEPMVRCAACGTLPTHPHLLTERLLCDCEAHRHLKRNEPVLLRRPLLRVPATVVDDYGTRQDVVRQVVAA